MLVKPSRPSPFQALRQLERRLENNSLLNLIAALGEIITWSLLVFGIASSPLTGFQFMTAAFHGVLAYQVNRHIYRYEYPRAIQETWPLRRMWSTMLIGHVLLLVVLSQVFWLGTILAWVLPQLTKHYLTRELPQEYEQGSRATSLFRVREHFEARRRPSDPGAYFGGVWLPIESLHTHVKIIGGTRSGKTNLLRLLMQSVLPYSYLGNERRAAIYDPKSEFLSLLVGMGIPEDDIRIANPMDARGSAWDLAKDLTTNKDAEALAGAWIPERPDAGSGKFFDDASRRVLSAIIKVFMKYAPGRWTPRDISNALQSVEMITLLLSCDDSLSSKSALQVMGSGETRSNVMATLLSVVSKIETVAAYSDIHYQAGRTFTLKDWLNGHHILLLGCDRISKETLQPLNQLLLTRLSQLLTSVRTDGHTFLILDELPELGRIGDIDRVAKLAAQYNVCLVIAFQAYSDLKKIYGDNLANSLIGQCANSAYLRVQDDQTAEWQAKQLGQTKIREKMKSYTTGTTPGGKTPRTGDVSALTEQKDKDYLFPAEYFQALPQPDYRSNTGVKAAYKLGHFIYKHEVSSATLSQHMCAAADVEGFVAISAADTALYQNLRPWTTEDAYRLGFDQLFANLPSDTLEGTPIEGLIEGVPDTESFIFEPVDLDFLDEEGENNDDGNILDADVD